MNALAEAISRTSRLPRASAFIDPATDTADDAASSMIGEFEIQGRQACRRFLDGLSAEQCANELEARQPGEDIYALLLCAIEAERGVDVTERVKAALEHAREDYIDRHWDEYAEKLAIRQVEIAADYS